MLLELQPSYIYSCIYQWLCLTYRYEFIWHEQVTAPGKYRFSKIKLIIGCKARETQFNQASWTDKLDSISDVISQTVQNKNISPAIFYKSQSQSKGRGFKNKTDYKRKRKE